MYKRDLGKRREKETEKAKLVSVTTITPPLSLMEISPNIACCNFRPIFWTSTPSKCAEGFGI